MGRWVEVLNAFLRQDEWGVRDLATATGLPRSAAHRILHEMQRQDLLSGAPGGRFRVGPLLVRTALILADRLDVQEELSRFRAHIEAFRAALASAQPDGVGKRLGFLLQEMLREANTTGSKGNDAAIVTDVLLVKEELERIREQVENLE